MIRNMMILWAGISPKIMNHLIKQNKSTKEKVQPTYQE